MSTATNKGSQNIFFQFGDPLTGSEFNSKESKISPLGIYDGAMLAIVNNTTVEVGAWTAVISDGTYTVTARATSAYEVTGVSSTDRNIVLRWTYSTQNDWYVDILAVSDANVQTNDLIVGRAVYSGATLISFNYSTRNDAFTIGNFLRVIPTSPASMKVVIKGGWCTYGSSRLSVSTQALSSALTAPTTNPRIDLVYVDVNGAIQVATGVEAVSPSSPTYSSRIILAEITLQTTSTTITASMIRDVRSFMSINTSGVYPGFIGMHSGTVASIPSDWGFCDGSTYNRVDGSGTIVSPDLRDKMVVGAKQDDAGVSKTNISGSLTKSGGAANHSHPGGTLKTQPITTWTNRGAGTPSFGTTSREVDDNSGGSDSTVWNANDVTVDGNTAEVSGLNPYYALAFVMKL